LAKEYQRNKPRKSSRKKKNVLNKGGGKLATRPCEPFSALNQSIRVLCPDLRRKKNTRKGKITAKATNPV